MSFLLLVLIGIARQDLWHKPLVGSQPYRDNTIPKGPLMLGRRKR